MPHSCKIRCIETGIIYNSIKEAIEDVGLKNDNVTRYEVDGYLLVRETNEDNNLSE